jgi:hypothetical protein
MTVKELRKIWCKNMEKVDTNFFNSLQKNAKSTYDEIRIVKIEDLRNDLSFSDPTIDPRDILCFVEKCVDERFLYNRCLPQAATSNPRIKYNYRQAIVDFGIPGVGCLYSTEEAENIGRKIAKYLKLNNIPVFVSESHEGCGAVKARIRKDNYSDEDTLFVAAVAQENALNAAKRVEMFSKEIEYQLDVFTKYATMDECYRVKNKDNSHDVARIHNGSGIIFLPNFFEKKQFARVFLPDKFCLSNGLCMFNMIDCGLEFDKGITEDLNPNSTAEYIIFCIKIMLGNYGLGVEFFNSHNPLTIIAACDAYDSADALRSYKIINQVRALIASDQTLSNIDDIFDFTILEF